MARKKPVRPAGLLESPPCMVVGCPGRSHRHGLCESHWLRPVPVLEFSVAPVDAAGWTVKDDADAAGWEACVWRSDAGPGRPEYVEVFPTEAEAAAAVDAYVAAETP